MSTTELDSEVEPTDNSARPMRKDAVRNRALLIAAARVVFARRGHEASLDDIAKQAGVGVGTAYRHFANKYDLAAAIMDDSIDGVVREAERAELVPDPWDGLVAFIEAVIALQTKDHGLREVMMGVHDPAKSDAVHDRIIAPVTRLFDRAKGAGAVRADAVPSDLGFVSMMLCQVADISGELAPEMWRRYLPTLLSGLRPGGPPLCGQPFDDAQFRKATAAHHFQRLQAATTTAGS